MSQRSHALLYPALNISSLSDARLLMRSQTAGGGGLISVVPLYLLVPSA